MISDFKVSIKRNHKNSKVQRLALIKERYEKLILIPKKEVEFEIERDLREESELED